MHAQCSMVLTFSLTMTKSAKETSQERDDSHGRHYPNTVILLSWHFYHAWLGQSIFQVEEIRKNVQETIRTCE